MFLPNRRLNKWACCPILQLQEPGILPSHSKLIYVLFQILFGLTLPTDKFRMASRLVSRWILLHQRFRGIVKQWVILLRYDRFLCKTIKLTLKKKFQICWLDRWFPTLEIVMLVFYFEYTYAVHSLSFGVILFHIAMIWPTTWGWKMIRTWCPSAFFCLLYFHLRPLLPSILALVQR